MNNPINHLDGVNLEQIHGKMNIHYRLSDGEITGWGNATVEPASGCAVIALVVPYGQPHAPDPDVQKIDLKTHQLVEKNPDEQAISKQPNALEISIAVANEMAATDQFVNTPDRPVAPETKAAWIAYRAALRALSKLPNPVQMMNAWPARPDAKPGDLHPMHLHRLGKHMRFR